MQPEKMNQKDPLHRLYSTPTKASNHQRWDVFHEMEKNRKHAEKRWGIDEKMRIHARKIASTKPPSIATRKKQNKLSMKSIPYSSSSPKKAAKRKVLSSRRSSSYGKKSIPYSSNSPKIAAKRKAFSSRRPSSYGKNCRNLGKKKTVKTDEAKLKIVKVRSRVEVDEIKKLEEELDALLDEDIENPDSYIDDKKNQSNSIVNKKGGPSNIIDKELEKSSISFDNENSEMNSVANEEEEKSKQQQKQVAALVEGTISELSAALDKEIEELKDIVDQESKNEEEQEKVMQHDPFENTETTHFVTSPLPNFPDNESKEDEVTKVSENKNMGILIVAQTDTGKKQMMSPQLVFHDENIQPDNFFDDNWEDEEEQYDESKEQSYAFVMEKKSYLKTSVVEEGIEREEKEPIDTFETKEIENRKDSGKKVDSFNTLTKNEEQNIVPNKFFTVPKVELKRVKSKAVEEISMVSEEDSMKVFDSLDESSSGKLSIEKLDQAVTILWRKLDNKPAIMAAYKATDRFEKGFIERSAFGYFLSFVHYYNNLWPLFDIVDGSNNRSISRDQFLKASPKLNVDNPLMFFKNIDSKKSGRILFDELCDYMAKGNTTWVDESNVENIQEEVNISNLESKEKLTPAPKVLSESTHQTIIKVSDKEKEDETFFFDQIDTNNSQKLPFEKVDELESKIKKELVLKPRVGKIKSQNIVISIPSKEEAMKVFDQLDVSGSRKLSLVELDMCVMTLYPGINNKLAIMAAYASCDCAGEGYVQRHKFGYFLRFIYYHNYLWSMFGTVNNNSHHHISKNDFLQASPKLNIDNPLSVFRNMDKNNEGTILFDNLCDYMAVNFATWDDERDIAKIQTKFTKFICDNIDKQRKSTPPRSRIATSRNFIHISLPSKEEEKKVFDELKDSFGRLPLTELEQSTLRLYPGLDNKEAIMAASKASDCDQDGMINSDEFSYFLKYLLHYNNLRSLFREGNGESISKDCFLNASRHMEIDNPMMVFKKLKKEGEKSISFCKICEYMVQRHIL